MPHNKKDFIPPLIILTAGILLGLRLIMGGCLYTDDAASHTLWAQQFVKGFDLGAIYPRWASDTNTGCGSPVFIFYPPFIFYTYAIISQFVKEIPQVMIISAILGLIASGMTMYIFSSLFLRRASALISAIMYMALPYHLLDIYYRSAMAEFWTFAWLPLILYYVHKSRKGLSLSYACLIMTHLPTVLLFTPFLFAYIIFLFVKERKRQPLFSRFFSIGLGITLSAIFLLPALFEQGHVNIEVIKKANFWNNFLFSEHAYEKWLNKDITNMAVALLLIFIFSMGISIFRSVLNPRRGIMPFFSLAGMVSVFFMTALSQPVWAILAIFQKVQYPWRILSITCVFGAVCLGGIFNLLYETAVSQRIKASLFLIFLAGLTLNGILSYRVIRDYVGFEGAVLSISGDMSYEELRRNYNVMYDQYNHILFDAPEYRPIWSLNRYKEGALPEGLTNGNKLAAIIKGDGRVKVIRWHPENRLFNVETTKGGILLLRTFYYPSWKAYIGDNALTVDYDHLSGLISIIVPAGPHNIEVRFEGAVWQRWGGVLSFLSLAALLILYLFEKK